MLAPGGLIVSAIRASSLVMVIVRQYVELRPLSNHATQVGDNQRLEYRSKGIRVATRSFAANISSSLGGCLLQHKFYERNTCIPQICDHMEIPHHRVHEHHEEARTGRIPLWIL